MIREISGRGLVPKKTAAAAKNEKVKNAQEIMIKIVEAYESQNEEVGLNLLFPGSVDGIWGDLTNTSYKNILSTFKKNNPPPANIDAAIGELNEILTSLNVSALSNTAQARAAALAAEPAKPASPEKADDAKAKAGFKNLLDLLQSKRLNLSAGGNEGVFKQRIERDWMAIIRAYGSTDSVVETFYPHLGLTGPEKILLADVNEKTNFDTNYSPVLAKINNKFLETISKYIKPIGRAFRTERGMARVIDRRQKREEKRSNSLERLNILSKVAARKGVARARLEKTAIILIFPAMAAYIGVTAAMLASAVSAIGSLDVLMSRNNMTKGEFDKKIGEDLFEKTMKTSLDDWLKQNDPESQRPLAFLNQNYIKAAQAWVVKTHEINEQLEKLEKNKKSEMYTYEDFFSHPGAEYFKKIMNIDIFNWMSKYYNVSVPEININMPKYNFRPALDAYLLENQKRNKADTNSTDNRKPSKTNSAPGRRAPATDPTARMRTLFQNMNLPVDNATGWTETINNSFKDAYDAWKAIPGNENKPDISNGWRQIAPQIGFSNDISGATDLVEVLYSKNWKDYTGTQQAQTTPPPPVAADAESAYNDTNRAKTKLTELFDKILSGSTKVDRVGIDLRNDTKIFKGVIRGLGGVMEAVEYVFSEVKFTPEQLAELTRMNFDSNQKIAINALSPVRNLFVNIRKVSTDGIGRDRRGLTEDSLARSVARWLGEQTATPPPVTGSIRKSIEIRKMAARKKLGF